MAAALALATAAAVGLVRCHTTSSASGGESDAAADVDAEEEPAPPCDGGAPDVTPDALPVALPAACALPNQRCNPLDETGCNTAAGQTCDLGRDGTFACASLGDGGAAAGAACNGVTGPFCGTSMTCVEGHCAAFCCAASDCQGGLACVPMRAMKASGGSVGTCQMPAAADGGGGDAGIDGASEDGATPLEAGAPADGGFAGDGGALGDGGPAMVGNHVPVFEGRGFLVPWTTWNDALTREMSWYANTCGQVSGYPVFATAVHIDGNCQVDNTDTIPAMEDGMGILSYLKYYVLGGRQNQALLTTARGLADYLVQQALTPEGGAYPAFPRSTGQAQAVPQSPSCGTEGDQPYEVEPDKGGIVGHALMMLASETGDATYSAAALRIAETLVTNMGPGDGAHTPWPFRVDYRTGKPDGNVSSNLSYILRLFDDLLPTHPELMAPRTQLWTFIKTFQIPDVFCKGQLWAQFFEDMTYPLQRNAWAPLNLARYILEQQGALDPDWQADATALLGFVNGNFVDPFQGFPVCIEQDFDRKPFGGILSNYGAVSALYAKAMGTYGDRLHAYQVLTLLIYEINDDGCPGDEALTPGRGGWQEDAHLDKIHNFADALGAFPDWQN